MPWAAIARLQVPGVSRCTTFFVTPNLAITAAHCLTKRGLGHFVQPGSIHLLLGYKNGAFTRHLVPDALILPSGADPAHITPSPADFAVLHVATPVAHFLRLDPAPLPLGTPLRVAGFNQDRAERLEADPGCHALGYARTADAGPFLLHDCTATHGSSGGPVLAGDAATGFGVVGLQDAANPGTGGIAIPAAAIARLLPLP